MDSGSRKSQRHDASKVVHLPCACATLRRTARLVSQMYEEAIRPTGVTGPQFTLLQALKFAPGLSQNQLANVLGMDSTTLTRSLALLRKQGWIRSTPGSDRRALRLSLTHAGEKQYDRVLPYWESAQKRLKRALGDRNWNQLLAALVHTTELLH